MKKDVNVSLTGSGANGIRPIYKVGVTLFVLGIVLLVNGFSLTLFFDRQTSIVVSFSLMYAGATTFTFRNVHRPHQIGSSEKRRNRLQVVGLSLGFLGMITFAFSWLGWQWLEDAPAFVLTFSLFVLGILLYTYGAYRGHTSGIKNNHNTFNSLTSRGLSGWLLGIVLTLFYLQLYWFDTSLKGVVSLFNPLSHFLRNEPADKWFMYGSIYTFVIFFLGIKFMVKYWHSRYQLYRTLAVVFSQVVFAYFLPQILEGLNYVGATDASGVSLGYYSANPVNSWPLNYSFFEPGTLKAYIQPSYQPVGQAYLIWGIVLFLVLTPIFTYYVGKRWYCSWLCGCGGLAETAGDPFRHLSSKTLRAWQIERWLLHSIMVLVLVMTLGVTYTYFSGNEFSFVLGTVNKDVYYLVLSALLLFGIALLLWFNKQKEGRNKVLFAGVIIMVFILVVLNIAYFGGMNNLFIVESKTLKGVYGFFIGATFSGVIGVGFYPLLGNRIWCRFGCPMAGYMGLFQRFKSRFRITTNGGQCISCGNCSTYCEQGIDVRAYAQKGQNIVRSSCVGCGICSEVCPRGVLKLENGPEEGRIG